MAALRTGPGEAGQRQVEGGVRQLSRPVRQAGLPVGDGRGARVLLVRACRRQFHRLAQHLPPVHGEHVVQQDREGVTVVDQVVLDVHDTVVPLAQPGQAPAQQRRLGGVERRLGLGPQQLLERGLRVGLLGQVHGAHPRRTSFAYPLFGHLARPLDEFEAQAGVPVEGGAERGAQGRLVEPAPEVDRRREVVGTAARQHLLVQPDDVLGR